MTARTSTAQNVARVTAGVAAASSSNVPADAGPGGSRYGYCAVAQPHRTAATASPPVTRTATYRPRASSTIDTIPASADTTISVAGTGRHSRSASQPASSATTTSPTTASAPTPAP